MGGGLDSITEASKSDTAYITYMHVDALAVTLRTANDGSNYDQLVLRDKVADASLVLAVA